MTMAIPFTLPSDQETEDNYRRLNQLLIDLYEVIQILIRPPRSQVSGPRLRRDEEVAPNRRSAPVQVPPVSHSSHPQVPSMASPTVETSRPAGDLGLPDLVLSSVPSRTEPRGSDVQTSRKVLPPRRQRRKQNKEKRVAPHSHSINFAFGLDHNASSSSHHQVSNRTSSSLNGEESVLSETKSVEVKASSLVSLLVPASISGQIWTTILIIVGWKLLARHR